MFTSIPSEAIQKVSTKKLTNVISGKRIKNILFLGAGKSSIMISQKLSFERNVNIIGYLDDNYSTGFEVNNGKKVLGKLSDFTMVLKQYLINEVIIAINRIEKQKLFDLITAVKNSNLSIKIYNSSMQIIHNTSRITKIAGFPLIEIHSNETKYYNQVKRIIDVSLSLAGIIALTPVLAAIALIIKVSSKGPVIFTQSRIGLNGKPFKFYKFRSMKVIKGEDEDRKEKMIQFMKNNITCGPDTKIINDHRVTSVGKIIRKTSLDELPQLFNVLKGDMSLVGPRPCLPYEFENYNTWQKNRVNVLPGCTGLWQISGRSSVSFDESILLDIHYIYTKSISKDLKIIFMTIPVMLGAKGGK